MTVTENAELGSAQVSRRSARESIAKPAGDDLPPPRTRREMKERGILLTTEIPVVDAPPGWDEAVAAGTFVGQDPADADADAVPLPGPGRHALREEQLDSGDPEDPQITSPMRRPVVRPAPEDGASPVVGGRRAIHRPAEPPRSERRRVSRRAWRQVSRRVRIAAIVSAAVALAVLVSLSTGILSA